MDVDQVSLFLHVLAATGLIGAGLVQVMAGSRLRGADTVAEMRLWASFVRSCGPLLIGSAAVSLLTGGHLAGAVWTTPRRSGFSLPFITLGVVALLVLAPIGPMLGGARLRRLLERIRRADAADHLASLRAEARSPALWGPVHSLVGVGVGFVWVMTSKPGWTATAIILVTSFAVGWLTGVVVARR